MNETGTNTAHSTRPMATTGPLTSSMAFSVACTGLRPCSMWCSTASTTTMASSTTMPTASTTPSIVSVLMENPEHHESGEGSDQRDRHREHGDESRAEIAEEDEHHDQHEDDGVPQRQEDLMNGDLDELGGVQRDAEVEPGREVLRVSSSILRMLSTVWMALAPGS